MDLNKSETRWVAAGIGGAIGFISWAKDIKWIPGPWKYAIAAVLGYLWYFGFVPPDTRWLEASARPSSLA